MSDDSIEASGRVRVPGCEVDGLVGALGFSTGSSRKAAVEISVEPDQCAVRRLRRKARPKTMRLSKSMNLEGSTFVMDGAWFEKEGWEMASVSSGDGGV